MAGNPFQPVFSGRFEVRDGDVFLAGRFALPVWARLFWTCWSAFTVLSAAFAVVRVVVKQASHDDLLSLASLVPLAGLGVGLLAFSRWLARKDCPWLSEVIQKALRAPRQDALLHQERAGAEAEASHATRVFAAGFALFGVLAFTAVMRPASDGSVLSGTTGRLFVSLLGLVLLAIAVGVFQRRLAAWRVGLAVIGALGLLNPVWLLANPPPMPLPAKLFLGVGSVIVAGGWGLWWYAQRVHFPGAPEGPQGAGRTRST